MRHGSDASGKAHFRFGPSETYLIVFNKDGRVLRQAKQPNQLHQPVLVPGSVSVPEPVVGVEGPWTLTLHQPHPDTTWTATFDSLQDFKDMADSSYVNFMGTVVYRTTFNAAKGNLPKVIDLGKVADICELKVNGKDAGTALRKVSSFCKGIWQGFVSCLSMKRAWWFFLLTLMIWGCYWMMSATILWAVQGIDPAKVSSDLATAVAGLQDLNLSDAMFLMLAGSLSSLVPVPGGFGAFHFIVAGAISYAYGLPFEFGIIFATLSHESQGVNQLVWGAISYISEQFRKKI